MTNRPITSWYRRTEVLRHFGILVVVLMLAFYVSMVEAAGKRVALVIGNSEYQNRPLKNPVNDARDMERTLRSLGFDVERHSNLDRVSMHRAIRTFGNRLRDAEIGLFYYAGHGIQLGGNNYLLPAGEDIQEEDEVPYQSINAGQVLAKMESAQNPVNIVILDACRNNPLVGGNRTDSRGLTRMDAPTGSLVLYATAPGKTAVDGDSFTQHLIKHLKRPGLTLSDVVLNTRVDVMAATDNQQVPWEASSLTRRVILLPGSESEPARSHARLFVNAEPEDARIRILNITPRYKRGMALAPGENYRIEVAAAGYRKYDVSHRLDAGDQVIRVSLEPLPKSTVAEPDMVRIRGGLFKMGSPTSEKGREDYERSHDVRVEDFYIGKYEVTVKQFRAFVETTGYRTDAEKDAGGSDGCYAIDHGDSESLPDWRDWASWRKPNKHQDNRDKDPVSCVSFNDAQAYIEWLNKETGQTYRLRRNRNGNMRPEGVPPRLGSGVKARMMRVLMQTLRIKRS